MQELTVEEIVTLHAAIIARDGGDDRIISEANLHQLVFRSNQIAESIPRAALALFSLVAYPAFREGNERAALALATRILAKEGYAISAKDAADFGQLAESVRAFTAEPEEIEAWLTIHVKKEQ